MTAAEERCELTELLPAQCGCRVHRGGQTPQEEVATELTKVRSRLLGDPRWFAAQYPGTCGSCGERFQVGAAIRMRGDRKTVIAFQSNVIAECCAEEPKW